MPWQDPFRGPSHEPSCLDFGWRRNPGADVGAAKGRIIEKLRKQDPFIDEEIEILSTSSEMPDNTLCVRSDLPIEFKVKLQQVLLTMHENPEGREVLKALEVLKFVEAKVEDFEPTKRIAKEAGVDIKNFNYNY